MSVLSENLSLAWSTEGYSQEQIDAAIDCIDVNKDPHSEKWIKLPDIKFLDCVKEYTDRVYAIGLEPGPVRADVQKDIEAGVTFALWEEEGRLLWER